MVKKGDLLFVIDPRPFQVAKAQAEAQLADAQAKLENTNRQLERASKLRRDDYTSQSTVDERLQDRNVAAAAAVAGRKPRSRRPTSTSNSPASSRRSAAASAAIGSASAIW